MKRIIHKYKLVIFVIAVVPLSLVVTLVSPYCNMKDTAVEAMQIPLLFLQLSCLVIIINIFRYNKKNWIIR